MDRLLKIESRSIDYVPLRERHGKVWHLWAVWFTGDAHLATLATGAIAVSIAGASHRLHPIGTRAALL